MVDEQDLVTAFPRSAENHGPNGITFKDGWLYIALGSNTNRGAQSKFFSFYPETPMSAAIIRVESRRDRRGDDRCTEGARFSCTDLPSDDFSLLGTWPGDIGTVTDKVEL